MNKNWFARLLTGLLCLTLLSGAAFLSVARASDTAAGDGATQTAEDSAVLEDPAVIEEGAGDEAVVKLVATATVALKVRRAPDEDAVGNGSIGKDDPVYIVELGDEWSKVDTGRNIGYVQTRYLTNIRDYTQTQGEASQDAAQDETAAQTDADAGTVVASQAGTDSPETFQEEFKAYAYKALVMRKEMDLRSSAGYKVDKYEKVIVGAVHGEWSYIRYQNTYGYVLTEGLFKWDRIDPYAGDIPGASIHAGIAFLKQTTDIMSYEDGGKEVLKTINPGSAVVVEAMDENGLYPLPYWRTTGSVRADEVSYLLKTVPWDQAQSGDLISSMTTYYAVGVHTLQYQGRNYNIYLGTSLISGLVVQPGEKVDIHDVMGPYRKSTGYHRAPIWSPKALSGYGGGCCQVNTTLYNALIRAPILINWRKVHADVGIYYTPVGFDAAVGGGDITMIFTNTLPYSIRINFFMTDGCMTAAIFRV